MTTYRLSNSDIIFEGTKLDSYGDPVISAYVQIIHNATSAVIERTTTDKNGYWIITIAQSSVPSGRYTIRYIGSDVIQKPEPLGGWEELDVLSEDFLTYPIEAADVDGLLRETQTSTDSGSSRTWQFGVGINATKIVFKNKGLSTVVVSLDPPEGIYISTSANTITSIPTTTITGLTLAHGGVSYALGSGINILPSGVEVLQITSQNIIADAYKVKLVGTNLNHADIEIKIPTRLAAHEIDAGRIRVEEGISISAGGGTGVVIDTTGMYLIAASGLQAQFLNTPDSYGNIVNIGRDASTNKWGMTVDTYGQAQIAGWEILASGLTKQTASGSFSGIRADGAAGSAIRFFAGASDKLGTGSVFKVLENGALTATNATINGTITANLGSIAGFTITSDRLHSTNPGTILGMVSAPDGPHGQYDKMIFVGATTSAGAASKFHVDNIGSILTNGSIYTNVPVGSYLTDLLYPTYGYTGNIYIGSGLALIAKDAPTPSIIAFGTNYDSYDTFLYRSTAQTLKTDNTFIASDLQAAVTFRLGTSTTAGYVLTADVNGYGTWQAATGGPGASGIQNLNGLTPTTQYFTTGTSGGGFNISSTTATHTFNIPNASTIASGLITPFAQTLAGTKTFNDSIIVKSTAGAQLTLLSAGVVQGGINFYDVAANDYIYLTVPSTMSTSQTLTLPELTGTLATTAIAGGGTNASTAIGAFNNLSPLTTKGDLVTYSGITNVRQPIGIDYQVLVSDSAYGNGMRWGYDSMASQSAQSLTGVSSTITAVDGKPVTPLTSTGSYTLTSVPTIASGRDGQLLILVNQGSNSITLQDMATLGGSNLRLGSTSRTLTALRNILELVYDSVYGGWVEKAFTTVQAFTPSVNTFTVNGSSALTMEVAAASTSLSAPTFAVTYIGVPSTASINVDSGEISGSDYPITLPSAYTSLTSGTTPPSVAVYKLTTVAAVQTFTVTATVSGTAGLTKTTTITYWSHRYVGASANTTSLTSAETVALGTFQGGATAPTSQDNTATLSKAVTVNGSNYIWVCFLDAIGAPSYWSINSERAAVTLKQTASVTNDSGAVATFKKYRCDSLLAAGSYTIVATSSLPTNRIYMGPSTNGTSTILTAEILALDDTANGTSRLSATVPATYTVVIGASNYLWFCHPDSIADLATIKDATTGFAIDGAYQNDISHTNDMGYTESYRCWRSTNSGIYPSSQAIIVT